jgi:prevent-host-death family protein
MEPRTIAAGEFKAKCLALMDEVRDKRTPVVITKNGKPVAKLVPVPMTGEDPIFGFFKGKLNVVGDVISPIYTDEENEQFLQDEMAKYK